MADLDSLRAKVEKANDGYTQSREEEEKWREEVDRLMAELAAAQEAASAANQKAEEQHGIYVAAVEGYNEALVEELKKSTPLTITKARPDDEWLEPGADFAKVVIDAGRRDSGIRLPARRALERMGPKAIEPLLTIMRRESHKRNRRIRSATMLVPISCVIALLQLCLDQFLTGYPNLNWGICILLAIGLWMTRATRLQKSAADALAKMEDVRVVGPLAEALETEDTETVNTASEALARLLPRMRATDRDKITSLQLASLYRVLPHAPPSFSIPILKALEQVGDEKALPVVEKLAVLRSNNRDAMLIRQAANEILPALVDRISGTKPGARLLRPASQPADPAGVLLRPVTGSTAVAEDQLLRPASED